MENVACKIRAERWIVLVVASSGITTPLLHGGHTARSRFKIPIKLHNKSTYTIVKHFDLAELLHMVDLIIWDETAMIHRNAFQAVNCIMKDIMQSEGHDAEEKPLVES